MGKFYRRNRPVLIALLIVIVAGAGIYFLFFNTSSDTTGGTEIVVVKRGDIRSTIRTTGRTEAKRNARIPFRASGTVTSIRVQVGDVVPTGTVMIDLDDTAGQRDLANAESRLSIARFQLQSAASRAGISFADDLLNIDTPSTTPRARSTPALPANTSPADFYSAITQVKQAEADEQAARNHLDDYKVVAPFDGTVLNVPLAEGEGAGQGSEAVTLSDLTNLRIRADVDEVDVAAAAVGQSTDISLDAFSGQQFTGRITSISPVAAQRAGSTTFPALVDYQAPPGLAIRPGMAANLIITASAHVNTLIVPGRAIETIGIKKYVNRVTGADGHTERVVVETGLSNADQIEVVSGLNEGDHIAVRQ